MRRRVFKWTQGFAPRLINVLEQEERIARRLDREKIIVGLDLSLSAAACACVSLPWDGSIAAVRTLIVGRKLPNDAPPEAQVRRLDDVSNEICRFCAGADAVYVEEYAFSQGQSRAHALGELGGVAKVRLLERCGLVAIPVHNNTARKTLLQHVPSARGKPKGFVKKWVLCNVRRLGGQAATWTDDQVDAFVVMNEGIAREGGIPLSFAGE